MMVFQNAMVNLNAIVVKKVRGDYTMFLFTNIPPPPWRPHNRKAENYLYPPPPPPPPTRKIRQDFKKEDLNMYTVERIIVALVGLGIVAFLILSAMGII